MTADTSLQPSASSAVPTMFTADPMVGLRPRFVAAAAGRALTQAARRPGPVVRTGGRLATRLAKVAAGGTEAQPEKGDRRFTDEAWSEHPLFRRVGQGYLTVREEVYRLIDDAELDPKSAKRAQFAVGLVVESLSPSNSLLNPVVLRRAKETRGASLVAGARNFVDDVQHNGGMPSMVDRTPFSVGENVAVSPGRVVFKNDVLELIQYAPTTEQVYARPVLFVPPQINKFYMLDIGPGKSIIEWLVAQGHQVFAVSWRNPTAAQRDWGLDTYVSSLLEGIDAARAITGSDDVNITGACAGGITTAALLSHVAAIGADVVNAVTFLVTVLDTAGESAVSPFVTEQTIAAAKRRSAKKGVLAGAELGRVFAWLRPNDLVCNYWVNNWLLGEAPPAFDLLAWNADTTNLPAALHADFLEIGRANPFVDAGTVEVLGTPIDLTAFTGDAYVVGGLTDHITPWESCHRTLELLGGDTEFVLSTSGHIQAIVNPPSNPRARYRVHPDAPAGAEVGDAAAWFDAAEERAGSWWEHWDGWLSARSGEKVAAPMALGSVEHPPGDLAPGRYVHNL